MFSGVSNLTNTVDMAFAIILGISLFFLIGITFFMVFFVIKFNKKRHPKAVQIKENTKLEIAWTVIPTILVIFMFFVGWLGYIPSRKVPAGAMEIKVTGRMWSWTFDYPNGKFSNDVLVVPLNKAVKLNLYSPDVLHSFYVPAFRIKEDVVPGKENYMWFKAEKLGEYDVLCAEYCGLNHAYMLGKVKVIPEAEFIAWYNKVETDSSKIEPLGLQIIKKNACIACHSLDGSKIVGPSFKNAFDKEKTILVDGKKKKIIVDDEYIKRAIYDPNAEIVDGYNKGLMVSYKEQISEAELKEVILFLKSLHDSK